MRRPGAGARGGRRLTAALLLAAGLAAGGRTARAGDRDEPEVRSLPGGAATGEVVVAADVGRVRAFLADSHATHRIIAAIRSYTVTKDGPCDRVDIVARAVFRSIRYAKRRCATAEGARETFVESTDFEEFESEWWARPDPGGTRIRYQLHLKPRFPLPGPLLRAVVRDAVVDALVAARGALGS